MKRKKNNANNNPNNNSNNNSNNNPKKVKQNTSKKGDDAVNFTISIIRAIGIWDAKKMGEGTAADLAIRRAGTKDDWMPMQFKSCSTGKGKFSNLKGYGNMILCLVELTDGVGGKVWIGRRDQFPPTEVGDIYGKRKKAYYDQFRVLNPQNLNDRLHLFNTDPYIIKRPLNVWNVPNSGSKRKEALSVILFKVILASFGHTMVMPEYENTVTDWLLNERIPSQDKTAGRMNGMQYLVALHKSNGSRNNKQPYYIGDNQFYLIFIPDIIYTVDALEELSIEEFLTLSTTASLRGCYLFSEEELIAIGKIHTPKQEGQKHIRLPVPNADGSFEPESKYSKGRIHNFQPNYFHKNNFGELFERMLV